MRDLEMEPLRMVYIDGDPDGKTLILIANAVADRIIDRLDEWAKSRSASEYGLPLWDDEKRAHAREIVREAINA